MSLSQPCAHRKALSCGYKPNPAASVCWGWAACTRHTLSPALSSFLSSRTAHLTTVMRSIYARRVRQFLKPGAAPFHPSPHDRLCGTFSTKRR